MMLIINCQGDGKKAEAVATVLAAVDQARVRKPVHVDSDFAEEEMDIKQQDVLSAKQQTQSQVDVLQVSSATPSAPSEQTVHVTQVRGVSCL